MVLSARPTCCASAAAPAKVTLIDRESVRQKSYDLERPGRGGRLHALVGPPPRYGIYRFTMRASVCLHHCIWKNCTGSITAVCCQYYRCHLRSTGQYGLLSIRICICDQDATEFRAIIACIVDNCRREQAWQAILDGYASRH